MPPTLKSVAERAGVASSTASMALAGNARIAAATRQKVEAAARELGYQLNRPASLLAQQRHHPGRKGQVLSIALLKAAPNNRELFLEACAQEGVQGQLVLTGTTADPRKQMEKLRNQGVDALLLGQDLAPWPVAELQKVDWTRFSVVQLSSPQPGLNFHLIHHKAFSYMLTALEQVLKTGADKVAVLLFPSKNYADDLARLGAVLALKHSHQHQGIRIEHRSWEAATPKDKDAGSLRWLQSYQPQVILAFHWSTWFPLTEAGWSFPQDAGFAAVLAPGTATDCPQEIAACASLHRNMFNQAVQLCAEMVNRGERGFARRPIEHVVAPQWMPGASLGL